MAKFYGRVGFEETKEAAPGVWRPVITPRFYYGDVNRNSRNWQNGEGVNDDLALSNEISIIADSFAYENLNAIKWVEWNSVKWKVTGVDISYPRITLRLGGVYNAENETTGTA